MFFMGEQDKREEFSLLKLIIEYGNEENATSKREKDEIKAALNALKIEIMREVDIDWREIHECSGSLNETKRFRLTWWACTYSLLIKWTETPFLCNK